MLIRLMCVLATMLALSCNHNVIKPTPMENLKYPISDMTKPEQIMDPDLIVCQNPYAPERDWDFTLSFENFLKLFGGSFTINNKAKTFEAMAPELKEKLIIDGIMCQKYKQRIITKRQYVSYLDQLFFVSKISACKVTITSPVNNAVIKNGSDVEITDDDQVSFTVKVKYTCDLKIGEKITLLAKRKGTGTWWITGSQAGQIDIDGTERTATFDFVTIGDKGRNIGKEYHILAIITEMIFQPGENLSDISAEQFDITNSHKITVKKKI